MEVKAVMVAKAQPGPGIPLDEIGGHQFVPNPPQVDRGALVEARISQERDRIVRPLEAELAQIAEGSGRSGNRYSTGHADQRLNLFVTKAEQMGNAVVAALRDLASGPEDFSVEEATRLANREIDAIRLRGIQDLEPWDQRFPDRKYLDATAAKIHIAKEGAQRDAMVVLGLLERQRTRAAAGAVKTSDQVFVVMSFDPLLDALFKEAIVPAISRAGYRPYRVDRTEPEAAITDAILEAISSAPFVVGDLTLERPNCYYELGYARGIGKRVILSARKDHDPRGATRAPGSPRVHFDLDGLKITYWEDGHLDQLREVLSDRVSEVVKMIRGG